MTTRIQIVEAARGWLGTPFQHQARVRGVGSDCIGLVIGVGKELGLVNPSLDISDYSRYPDGKSLVAGAKEHMEEVLREDMHIGDMVVVAFDREPQHVGIVADYAYGSYSIIHAALSHHKVVEHRLLFGKRMRFVAAFKFKGID